MWDVAQERLFDQHFKQYIYFTIWIHRKKFRIVTHNAKVAAMFYPHCKNTWIYTVKGLNTKYMKFPFDPWISVLGEFLFNLSFRKIKYNTVLRSETYCRPLFSTCISGVMQRYSGFTRRKVAITPYTPAKWWPWSTMREGGWAV
jgi:hypothetical protein